METEDIHTRSGLALHQRRASALARLPGLFRDTSESDFLSRGMELVEELTDSRVSFIHFVHEASGEIELVTWSRRTLAEYCEAAFDRHYPIADAGIWADGVRTRAPFVCNDYEAYEGRKGLPEGHARLDRLISVPVFDEDGSVVMLTGVGNKGEAYTEMDVETVQLISNQIWQLAQLRRVRDEHMGARALLEELSSLAKAGGWAIDVATGTLRWTRSTWALHGLDPAGDLSLDEATDFYHPTDREILKQALHHAATDGTPYDLILRLQPRGGDPIWVRTTCTPQLSNGTPVRLVGTIQDVTDVRQEALKQRRMRVQDAATAARSVQVREEERALLGRELHDSIGQLLTAIRMDLELIELDSGSARTTPVDDNPPPGTVASAMKLTDRSLQLVQELSSRLREPILDDLGLVPALRAYARDFSLRSGLAVDVEVAGRDRLIATDVTTGLYRIAQEALTNVVRHAGATCVVIRVDMRDRFLILDVDDDGSGVDPQVLDDPSALGVQGMRERAEALGGSLEILPGGTSGSRVRARVPLARD